MPSILCRAIKLSIRSAKVIAIWFNGSFFFCSDLFGIRCVLLVAPVIKMSYQNSSCLEQDQLGTGRQEPEFHQAKLIRGWFTCRNDRSSICFIGINKRRLCPQHPHSGTDPQHCAYTIAFPTAFLQIRSMVTPIAKSRHTTFMVGRDKKQRTGQSCAHAE